MLKLPYGVSNFSKLTQEKYYFIDRTNYIADLESLAEPYLFFLRPRRFGKTLFVSLLQHYYGVEYAADFSELFGKYTIGQAPTPNANRYFVLRFDFSRIDTRTAESTFQGFFNNVTTGIRTFFHTYPQLVPIEAQARVLAASAPNGMIIDFFTEFKRYQITEQSDKHIYLLIDEYDHFANELLAFRYEEFKENVSRNGFVRKFYESIKTATAENIVDRLFVTGVSPLTLDSLTSGFNIGTNLTLDHRFHNMMGFTEVEVADILTGSGVSAENLPQITEDVRQWYNGYLFYHRAPERLYNPDMVLYFAKEYASRGDYPDKLLDINVASDYGKLRRMFGVGEQEEQNLAVLDELIAQGDVGAALTYQFSFEKVFTRDDFISLLFYMGIVTIKEAELDGFRFQAPNYVIEQLYYEFFAEVILTQSNLAGTDIRLRRRIIQLAQENQIAPLIEVVASVLQQLSNRDAVGFDEKYVKAIFAALLHTTQIYTIHSEYESERSYIDLLLTRRPPLNPNYQFVFELKYLKLSDASRLKTVQTAARQQLRNYLSHADLQALTDLRAWLIIFVGPEAKVVEQIEL